MINLIVMNFILHNNYYFIQYIFLNKVPEETKGFLSSTNEFFLLLFIMLEVEVKG